MVTPVIVKAVSEIERVTSTTCDSDDRFAHVDRRHRPRFVKFALQKFEDPPHYQKPPFIPCILATKNPRPPSRIPNSHSHKSGPPESPLAMVDIGPQRSSLHAAYVDGPPDETTQGCLAGIPSFGPANRVMELQHRRALYGRFWAAHAMR